MTKKRVCVLGWPVTHSRSPLIHNHWIAKYGVADASYEVKPVEPADLQRVLAHLGDSFIGANVTVPHKEAVFALLTRHDAIAQRLNAVNMLVQTPEGFEGRNTDGYGFIANLKDRQPDCRLDAGPALVLGAGGAARAIAVALEEAGVPDIRIINRSPERATRLIGSLKLKRAKAFAWDDMSAALEGAMLLINTTTRGMGGRDDLAPDLTGLAPGACVSDIVYTPIQTGLLQQAAAAGYKTVDGLGMLLHQAVPCFEAWFGVRPEVTEELRNLVLQDIAAG
ncbi:MAG: shikimate dehydrogenase [Rhizobiales bacterium]|nr:shikimate dehydrogenase [Hyphomicrobiales bacterium]